MAFTSSIGTFNTYEEYIAALASLYRDGDLEKLNPSKQIVQKENQQVHDDLTTVINGAKNAIKQAGLYKRLRRNDPQVQMQRYIMKHAYLERQLKRTTSLRKQANITRKMNALDVNFDKQCMKNLDKQKGHQGEKERGGWAGRFDRMRQTLNRLVDNPYIGVTYFADKSFAKQAGWENNQRILLTNVARTASVREQVGLDPTHLERSYEKQGLIRQSAEQTQARTGEKSVVNDYTQSEEFQEVAKQNHYRQNIQFNNDILLSSDAVKNANSVQELQKAAEALNLGDYVKNNVLEVMSAVIGATGKNNFGQAYLNETARCLGGNAFAKMTPACRQVMQQQIMGENGKFNKDFTAVIGGMNTVLKTNYDAQGFLEQIQNTPEEFVEDERTFGEKTADALDRAAQKTIEKGAPFVKGVWNGTKRVAGKVKTTIFGSSSNTPRANEM